MEQLTIHVLQHVAYEGLGCIENWIHEHNHLLSYTKFYESFSIPDIDTIEWANGADIAPERLYELAD